MKDLHYKIKGIRMSEETWKLLKEKRKQSGLSWNLYLLSMTKNKTIYATKSTKENGKKKSK